jgi:hypothetical protein
VVAAVGRTTVEGQEVLGVPAAVVRALRMERLMALLEV